MTMLNSRLSSKAPLLRRAGGSRVKSGERRTILPSNSVTVATTGEKKQEPKVKLERVLGCTATSSCAISVDQKSGLVAYPAGSTIVLYNPKTHQQAHLVGATRNHLTCLAFSSDGRYIASGECGHEPKIRVWELHDRVGQFVGNQVVELKNYKWGIACLRFTPNGQHLVAIGNQHDKSIVVWNWMNEKRLAENRLTSQVIAMDVSENGQVFVTVGVRHVKFWKAVEGGAGVVAALQGRSAILSDQRNNTFVDVVFGKGMRSFAITETRLLVEFQDKKLVNTYDLHSTVPYTLTIGMDQLYLGCANGIIRSMHLEPNIKHAMSFCKPHHLGVDVALGTKADCFQSAPNGAQFPDVHALVMNKSTSTLTAVYADHSIYQWRTLPNGRIEKTASQMFHVGPVFGLDLYPNTANFLPPGTFLTAGGDETIRMWNIDLRFNDVADHSMSTLAVPQKNLYSEELKKVLYFGNSTNSLCSPIERNSMVNDANRVDSQTGIKCLCVSPDGRHLAAGGRDGNIHVFDLATMLKIVEHAAHDGDVLCLEYTDPSKGARYLLASGSRDRLVHVFDPLKNYDALMTIDDHSSAIHTIKFFASAEGLEMFTCAADRLFIIRRLIGDNSDIRFERVNQISSTVALNDMTIGGDGRIVAACQDRQIRAYSMAGKPLRTIKGSTGDDGNLTKICLDPSGSFAATVCSDRFIYLIDAHSGECIAVLGGQADAVMSIAFSHDCRLSNVLTGRMLIRLKKNMAENNMALTGDRSRTPDSVIESGSEAASDDYGTGRMKLSRHLADGQLGCVTSTTTKENSESSEFGSLNSVRIDEDDDSCLGQKPAAVLIAPMAEDDESDFQVKRLPTEVVRRSGSTSAVGESSSAWDLRGSNTGDFSDEEDSSTSASRPDSSSAFPSSRSMFNLRPGVPPTNVTSPRRQRRKWDLAASTPEQQPANGSSFHSQGVTSSPQQNVAALPSGFMFMTGGNTIYRDDRPSELAPSILPRTNNVDSKYVASGVTASPIAQMSNGHRHFPAHLQTPPTQEDSFSRTMPGRVSLTRRHLNGGGGGDASFDSRQNNPESSQLWSPASFARRTTSNMHSTPSGAAAAAITRRQTEYRSAIQNPPASIPNTRIFTSPNNGQHDSSMRRRSALRMRQQPSNRRMTVSHFDEMSSPHKSNGIRERREDEYANSELHLRSRSQSPSQLALHETNSLSNIRRPRERQDSDMSMASSNLLRSSRLTPSSSRTNLRADLDGNHQSSQLNQLTQMRERLRKSQENLAAPIGDEYGQYSSPFSLNGAMARSKSIGNLRFSAAPPLDSSSSSPFSALHHQQHNNRAPFDNRENSSFGNNRHLARSVGSLHQELEATPSSSIAENEMRRDSVSGSKSRLAQTIRDLKKASNPDLADSSLYNDGDLEDEFAGEDGMSNSFYSALSLPRNGRKGAVQKKVERYQPKYKTRLEQASGTTGESSDMSDLTFSPSPQLSVSGNRRYFASQPTVPIRTVSSMESTMGALPRPGTLQNARRIFEPQRNFTSAVTPRRAPNYLAQKMANVDIGGPDMGNDDSPRHLQLDPSIFTEFESRSPQSKQMARHVADCLEQFNVGLEKVLGARKQLLDSSSNNIPPEDKDALLQFLNQALQNARRRLDQTNTGLTPVDDSRMEQEGGQSDGQNLYGNQRYGTTSTAPNPPQFDQVWLQRHGQNLMEYLQKSMAKQN